MTRFRLKPALSALAAILCASGIAYAATTSTFFGNVAIPNRVIVDGSTGAPITSANPLPVQSAAVSQGYTASAAFNRPGNTTTYTANDVVGAATAALTFSSIAPSSGGDILITSVELEIDDSALISGEGTYNLYLYSVTPPSAASDNAAFDFASGDRASFLGKLQIGIPVDEGSTLYVRADAINAHIKAASANLYGYLVTTGAYTPSSGRAYKVTLHTAAL